MAYSESFLREFFELYKEQECLWKIKLPSYHDKNARKRAMGILVAKFQEVKNDANENFVKKKINNFRTSYKRELKLVKNSSKSDAGSEEIYKPKLWYFELLSFLGDQDLPRTPVSNMFDEEEIRVSLRLIHPTRRRSETSRLPLTGQPVSTTIL
ncbi:hypothetical protein ABEB36_009647 [Hypothenemus hampei]|uniref:MADF domain-containing protein n=1 Tax=Hypothenemus hampei TaxID=57062 RepID=A0ABD1EGY9_HYPHA